MKEPRSDMENISDRKAEPSEYVKDNGNDSVFRLDEGSEEFNRKYHIAAMSANAEADRLLSSLSKESKADVYNFASFSIPALIIIFAALSFIVISRGDIEEKLSVRPSFATFSDGSYTDNLNSVYEETIPFKDKIVRLGAMMGFCDAPDDAEPDDPVLVPGDNSTDEPAQTQPAVTVPEQSSQTDSADVTTTAEDTEPEEYQTFVMYSKGTLNVRFGPSTDDAILGYFKEGDSVDVILLRDDGWAEVVYNGIKAYVFSEFLSEKEVSVTTKRNGSRTEITDEPEVTALPIDSSEPEQTDDTMSEEIGNETSDTTEASSEETTRRSIIYTAPQPTWRPQTTQRTEPQTEPQQDVTSVPETSDSE